MANAPAPEASTPNRRSALGRIRGSQCWKFTLELTQTLGVFAALTGLCFVWKNLQITTASLEETKAANNVATASLEETRAANKQSQEQLRAWVAVTGVSDASYELGNANLTLVEENMGAVPAYVIRAASHTRIIAVQDLKWADLKATLQSDLQDVPMSEVIPKRLKRTIELTNFDANDRAQLAQGAAIVAAGHVVYTDRFHQESNSDFCLYSAPFGETKFLREWKACPFGNSPP